MTKKLIPRSMWSFPSLRFPFSLLGENEDEWLQDFSESSGLSVYEDEDHVFVEAALPGIKSNEIEMTFEKGILWIKAEKEDEHEDKTKKYYRKSTGSFSYRVAVPGTIDETIPPEAFCKNGILKITFSKTKKNEARKIPIKEG